MNSMIRSSITHHTEGYGNTRNGIVITMDRIRDNDICDKDLNAAITTILGVMFAREFDPTEKDALKLASEEQRNNALVDLLVKYQNMCPDKDAGHNKFMSVLTAVCWGRPGLAIPALVRKVA